MATAVLTSQSSVKNCMGWMFSPLPQVGSQVGTLETTPTGLDSASKIGCKSQSYTSWDCVSRLYVGGMYLEEDEHAYRITPIVDHQDWIEQSDVPDRTELAKMSHADVLAYNKGKKVFVRGTGMVTKHQMGKIMQTRLRRPKRVLASGSKDVGVATTPSPQSKDDPPPPPPDPNLGYFYSDTLPVRVVASSSMIAPRETEPMPYSPQYQILSGRLNDPAQTGVLSSVVRGPNVRDATTMSSLVKAMSLRPSTRYEIAPMLRCGAMALSVATESYTRDPIFYRFLRKPSEIVDLGLSIMQKPGTDANGWRAVAMPLDTFVALANNSYYPSTVNGFEYSGLDVTWTAVPVPSRLLGQSHLLAYLFSFLSSDAWSGTVFQSTTTTRSGVDHNYRSNETYIPVINSIDIPGVRNVALVLVDETSQNSPNSFRISVGPIAANVSVWKGPNVVNSVPLWPLWDAFWDDRNINAIRRDTVLAFSEICTRLGVSDSCGTALSLLSELYGQWYQGIAVQNRDDTPAPDYGKPAHGCWTLDGSPLDKTGLVKSHVFDVDQPDKVSARRRCVAYNFSGISPLHLSPTGLVRIRYIVENQSLRIGWSTQRPEIAVPSYNVQTMTSIMRVGTAMGLVLTHTSSYRFASPTGFVHWIHMLAGANSFSTSAFLSINDITPKDWAGFYDKYDVAHRDMVLNELKSVMYADIVVHHNIQNLFTGVAEWDTDIIFEYWLVSPYDDPDWMTFSPVPFHCTQQWIDKLGLEGGTVPKGVTTFRYRNLPYMAMKLSRDHNEHKLNAVATIDMYRRFPQVLFREPGDNYRPLLHWIDNVAGYSNVACSQTNVLAPSDMYESMTFCASINNIGIPYSDPTEWYVIGSNYEYGDPSLSKINVTPIQWPDPPLLDTLWEGAKNYILKPAASALAGFLTGGPTGAAIAGASHIAQQLVTDLSKPETKDKNTEAVTKAEEAAKKVLGVNPTPTKADTSKTIKEKLAPATVTSAEAKAKGEAIAKQMAAVKQAAQAPPTGIKPTDQTTTTAKTVVTAPEEKVPEPLKALKTPDETPVNE